MLSITQLLDGKQSSKPYTSPLKIKVCGVGPTVTYTSDGQQKSCFNIGFADAEKTIKGVCYDIGKAGKLVEGKTVLLKEYGFRTSPQPLVVINTQTAIRQTSALNVDANLVEEAKAIANPPPAPSVSIANAKQSPLRGLVTVQGRVVSEEIVKTVSVKGSDVQVKNITLKDDSDSIRVSLWRDFAQEAGVGRYLTFSNVVVNSYSNQVNVATTARTTIEECEPPVTKINGTVQGYELGELGVMLMVEVNKTFTDYQAPLDLVATSLGCGQLDLLDTLTKLVPFRVEMESFNDEVNSLCVLRD